ncbi:MAG: saccharopine dehydrogenase C-terminal domain-containing protein [Planctomycetota bacterium]
MAKYRYAVLGAGKQGVAIAYDLARFGDAAEILLMDQRESVVAEGAARIQSLVPGAPVRAKAADFDQPESATLLSGCDVAVSALPYRMNATLARAAVKGGTSFCDLGGNTDVVRETLELDTAARAAGVCVVPDCGLAPGLNNVLAAHALTLVPGAKHVRMYCGGLPQEPVGPLGYRLFFSIDGLTNEYMGHATIVRGGRLENVEAFTEVEPFPGTRALGKLEAFFTSGGTSTAPEHLAGQLDTYEYKTIRYAGHFDKMRAMIELGLLDLEPVDVNGHAVAPRDLFHAVAEPRLDRGPTDDVVLLRVECTDATGAGARFDMVQRLDPATGFTAMEQGTGYPTAAIAHALAGHQTRPGAYTPERAGLGAKHLQQLRKRGLAIKRTTIRAR